MMEKKFSNSKVFSWCLLSFIVSTAIASFLPVTLLEDDFIWFFFLVAALGAALISYNNKKCFIFFLLAFFVLLGFWRYSLGLPQKSSDKIWFYNGEVITFIGRLVDEPDKREKSQKLKIEALEIIWANKKYKVEGNVLVSTDVFGEFEYGDKLSLRCDLKAPEEFEGFSYDRYLARFEVFSLCYYPKIEKLQHENGFHWQSLFYRKIFFLKNKIRAIINLGLDEPAASLGKAIILGDKKGIPEDLRLNFSRAGLSHIVAISGMHISILSALVMGFLLYVGMRRKHAFYWATCFLFLYIVVIGLPPSAMRAGMMGFLVLWALHLGRLNKLTNSLLLTAFILLLINPRLLRDDIGFQLSFLAVLGIAFVNPILENIFDSLRVPNIFAARKIFLLTISAQVFTLPVIAVNFGTVSLVAPLANLLVLWALPFLMIAMISGIILGGLFSAWLLVLFLPAKIILSYIIFIADIMTEVPYSYVYKEGFSCFLFLGYYLFCIFVIFIFRKIKADT